jgi:hypothetical protein
LAYQNVAIAEKFDAMVRLGARNSRMKNFYDVNVLARHFPLDGASLAAAVRATFEQRQTPLSGDVPMVLTREFVSAPERASQWRAFLRRGRLEAPLDAGELADKLRRSVGPVLESVSRGVQSPGRWTPGGPWR